MANPRPKAGPGRPKGSLNKITLEIKEIAQRYGERAIIGLASLAEGAESESARVAAWKELQPSLRPWPSFRKWGQKN
jgi:hypothetical protein